MPSGAEWEYGYWGNTDVPNTTNAGIQTPCAQSAGVNQAGRLKTKTHPGGLVEWYSYDSAGRQVGYRKNSDPWTCSVYNARGELDTTTFPAIAGFSGAARTVTYTTGLATDNGIYGYRTWRTTMTDGSMNGQCGANPAPPCGVIVTETDWAGRAVGYHDGYTQTTFDYDAAGRRTSTNSGSGAITRLAEYDVHGRPWKTSLGGIVLSTVVYSPTSGELSQVAYSNGTSLDQIIRDDQGRTKKLVWNRGVTLLASDEVTSFSQSGRIMSTTATNGATTVNSTYQYDAAGRLTKGVVGGQTWDYGYANSTCAAPGVAAAGKNSNRTSVTSPNGTYTYCYNNADRLISGTDPAIGASVTYDSHGNTTAIGGKTFTWDQADRNMTVTSGGTTTSYTRDALGRIRGRTLTGISSEDWRPGFDSDSDNPAFVRAPSGAIGEIFQPLPGGVTYFKRIPAVTTAPDRWSYPNIHGDTIVSTDATGAAATGLLSYNPDGRQLNGSSGNYLGATNYSWLGQHQRPTEADPDIIQMGARPYLASIGRFLSVDPVEAGGCNDYEYTCGDPTNATDLTGRGVCDPEKHKQCEESAGRRWSYESANCTKKCYKKKNPNPEACYQKCMVGPNRVYNETILQCGRDYDDCPKQTISQGGLPNRGTGGTTGVGTKPPIVVVFGVDVTGGGSSDCGDPGGTPVAGGEAVDDGIRDVYGLIPIGPGWP